MNTTAIPYLPDLDHEVAGLMRATLREMLPRVMLLACEIADDPDTMHVRMRLGPRETTAIVPGAPETAPMVAEFMLVWLGATPTSEWRAYVRREFRGWFREAGKR